MLLLEKDKLWCGNSNSTPHHTTPLLIIYLEQLPYKCFIPYLFSNIGFKTHKMLFYFNFYKSAI